MQADPGAGVIVTEESPGQQLGEYLQRPFPRSADRSCLRALYLVGKWLRWLQSLPVEPRDEEAYTYDDPRDLVEYCDLRMREIIELGYGWPPAGVRGMVSAGLARLVERASREDRQKAWAHGDYGSQNILWDGKTLTPIDFATSRAENPLLDVTYFIHRLEMLQIYFPWRRWPIATWKRAILRGYGRPDAEQSPMYQAMMIRHFHCRLKTYVRRPPLNLKQRIHNAWTRKCVRARLLQLVSTA